MRRALPCLLTVGILGGCSAEPPPPSDATAVAPWTVGTSQTSDDPRVPITDTARSERADLASALQTNYAEGAPDRSSVYQLLIDIDSWLQFRELHGGAERPDSKFSEYSLIALRLPRGAAPEQFTPTAHYLSNGIHVVFPAETPRDVAVADGDFFAFYRIARSHNDSWPMVRTIRFADMP